MNRMKKYFDELDGHQSDADILAKAKNLGGIVNLMILNAVEDWREAQDEPNDENLQAFCATIYGMLTQENKLQCQIGFVMDVNRDNYIEECWEFYKQERC